MEPIDFEIGVGGIQGSAPWSEFRDTIDDACTTTANVCGLKDYTLEYYEEDDADPLNHFWNDDLALISAKWDSLDFEITDPTALEFRVSAIDWDLASRPHKFRIKAEFDYLDRDTDPITGNPIQEEYTREFTVTVNPCQDNPCNTGLNEIVWPSEANNPLGSF